MSGKKHNKRLPKDHVSEKDTEPKYGHVFGEWDAAGGHSWKYVNPDDHKKTHTQTLAASGSYQTHSADDEDEVHTQLYSGHSRIYGKRGMARFNDGHFDSGGEGTGRTEFPGDTALVTGVNMMLGHKGEYYKIGGPTFEGIKASPAPKRRHYGESVTTTIEEDEHKTIKGNRVSAVDKTRIDITKKDHAVNVGKNFDLYIKSKGKLETGDVFKTQSGKDTTMNSDAKFAISSSQDMSLTTNAAFSTTSDGKMELTSKAALTISADTKITLKVGGSTIEISSSGIKINASGPVEIQGATTKIQGGGMPAPPTTFS